VEAQKQLNDYKFRLKKAEQEITTFEGNVGFHGDAFLPRSLCRFAGDSLGEPSKTVSHGC
jgi:hypothetical protein